MLQVPGWWKARQLATGRVGFFKQSCRFKGTRLWGQRYVEKWGNRGLCCKSDQPPLKVVLFGTDSFSLYSVRKMYEMKQDPNHRLQVLHLVTREPKPGSRNMQHIQQSEVDKFARELSIPLFYCESNSQLLEELSPFEYDIAVAVSFGKLIPKEFLEKTKFGGINIHPSLLPQLRGPAPLHWALLKQLSMTGVTCQTLDPYAFDRGKLLARTEEIPIDENETYGSLNDKLGKAGGELLAKVIDSKVYENPNYELSDSDKYSESYAPPIESRHRVVNLMHDTVACIEAKYRALGSIDLFHDAIVTSDQKLTKKQKKKMLNSSPTIQKLKPVRVKLINPRNAIQLIPDLMDKLSCFEPGQYDFIMPDGFINPQNTQIVIRANDGFIICDSLLVEKYAPTSPYQFQMSINKRGLDKRKKFRAVPPEEALLSQKQRHILSIKSNHPTVNRE